MSKDKKARHWAIIVYPSSAPNNWRTIMQNTGCEICISPLHDKDINESTGELKKAHYHTIISYANTTTYNNVLNLCESLNAPIPQAINSVKGAVRYMVHQDNPEKVQYNASDIVVLNGFDIDEYQQLSATQKYEIKLQIINYIKENNIIHYIDLVMDLASKNFDWYKVCVDNTILFNALVTSQYKKRTLNYKEELKKKDNLIDTLQEELNNI